MSPGKQAEGEVKATGQAEAREAEQAGDVLEQPQERKPRRQWRTDPFPVRTVEFDGYQLRLQESRGTTEGWQMQIRFGSGGKDDRPSEEVLGFIKSHRIKVPTKDGEKEVQLFHWNDLDRAWGMGIDVESPASSKRRASGIFNEVVEMVAEERQVGRSR